MFSVGHNIHDILLYQYAYFNGLGHCDDLEIQQYPHFRNVRAYKLVLTADYPMRSSVKPPAALYTQHTASP